MFITLLCARQAGSRVAEGWTCRRPPQSAVWRLFIPRPGLWRLQLPLPGRQGAVRSAGGNARREPRDVKSSGGVNPPSGEILPAAKCSDGAKAPGRMRARYEDCLAKETAAPIGTAVWRLLIPRPGPWQLRLPLPGRQGGSPHSAQSGR